MVYLETTLTPQFLRLTFRRLFEHSPLEKQQAQMALAANFTRHFMEKNSPPHVKNGE